MQRTRWPSPRSVIPTGWLRQAGYILSSGLPSLITEVSSGIVIIVFNAVILRLQGNTGVAAYGVIANLSLVVIAIYTGIAQGVQPLLSSLYGQGDRVQLGRMQRYGVTTAVATAAAVELLLFLFAGPVAAAFNSEGLAEMQQMAVEGLYLYFLCSIFAAYNTLLSNFFTSVERPRPAQLLSILRGFVLIIPMALALAAVLGMTGVWLACPITELLTAALGFFLYRHYRHLQQES